MMKISMKNLAECVLSVINPVRPVLGFSYFAYTYAIFFPVEE